MKSYEGYLDGATKTTLENINSGKQPTGAGSDSDDFAGAARIAPLVYNYRGDITELMDSARAQAAVTQTIRK